MLLQTNSYIVPAEKRAEHQRLLRRFRQAMARLGCDSFDVYEQVGPNWSGGDTTGRFVQILRFRDRKHQLAVQAAERNDPTAQALIAEFCELINLPYQQQQGLFGVGFYRSVVVTHEREGAQQPEFEEHAAGEESEVFAEDQPAPEPQPVEEPQYNVHQEPEPAPEAVEEQLAESQQEVLAENAAPTDELQLDDTELVIDKTPDEQDSKPLEPPAINDIDIEALAQEEISEGERRSRET